MDPLLHYLSLQMRSMYEDSPASARRRESLLRERELASRARRPRRRRELVQRAVALATVRRWRRLGALVAKEG